MPIEAGTQIGPYAVRGSLGAGGMGEVYQATDTKLDRDVALKVLPQAFTDDPDRLARFEREAKVLASLNHPNIGGIYGLEESGGTKALVLELIGGPTLADRIAQGPIPLDEAIPIATQIAEALEVAHHAGVIHRDLKPANIKIREDGTVKVLDFGLAKAFSPDTSSPDLSEVQTISVNTPSTQIGVIMGTAAYMSPEQARGKPVDKRTDIWAFGAVLYEMLTGKKAFLGEDMTDTLAAVVRGDPIWEEVPATLQSRLRSLLKRCMQKELRSRWHDIADVRVELEEIASAPPDAEPSETGTRQWPSVLPWAVVAVMSLLAAALFVLRPGVAPAGGGAPAHVQVALPPGVYLPVETDHPTLALSPDGARLVFVGDESGVRRLYQRELATPDIRVIEGTEGAASPFFSPDGARVAFFADSRLKTVSVQSGVPVDVSVVTESTVSRGATWINDGTFVYVSGANQTLSRLDAPDDMGTQGTEGPEGLDAWVEIAGVPKPAAWPSALPGGNALLFSDNSAGELEAAQVAAVSLDSGDVGSLVTGGTNPRYSLTGHVLYARGGSLYAVGYDPDRGELLGRETKILDGVVMGDSGAAQYSVAANGTLAFVAGEATAIEHELVWVERSGAIETLFDDGRRFYDPRLSPDGTQLAFMSPTGPNRDVWVLNLERSNLTRWTSDPGEDFAPVWRPDGALALATEVGEAGGEHGPALGSMTGPDVSPDQLFARPGYGRLEFPSSWSPDGRQLAFLATGTNGEADVYLLDSETGQADPFLATPFREMAPTFSPDGMWIAYVSDRSGRGEVYIQSFPEGGAPTQVSTAGGSEPRWSPDGQELFYRETNRLMAVVLGDDPADPAPPAAVFVDRFERGWTAGRANYDVSPDGTRFVMVRRKNAVAPTVINVVLNWPEALGVQTPP